MLSDKKKENKLSFVSENPDLKSIYIYSPEGCLLGSWEGNNLQEVDISMSTFFHGICVIRINEQAMKYMIN